MKNLRVLMLAFSLHFLVNIQAKAQDQVTQVDSLYSQILQEQRLLHIVFPKNYNPASTDKYEILYCLDDITGFITLEWGMLQWEGFIPKNMILVGITNPKPNGVNMRDRDFTPTKTRENTGGATSFLSFIKKELIPYINKKYNGSNDGNVLYGGSLGGLFVIHAFLNDPDLFTSYIAIDPSLWWNDFLLTQTAAGKLDSNKVLRNTLYIAGREGNAYQEMGVAAMDSVLRRKAPKGLDWTCVAYRNETHYSANFKGFWDGLKFSYGGFYASTGGYATSRKITIKPKGGIVLKNVPFSLTCFNLMANRYLHFTTNGTEPTLSSPTLDGDETRISLVRDSKIIVKSIGVRSAYDKQDSASFVVGDTLKAIAEPKKVKQGGLYYTCYQGTWDSFPDLKKSKPVKQGIADKDFDVNKLATDKNFVCILTGYIKIEQAGYYILEMGGGNDHSRVYVNNQKVLGNHFIREEGEMYLLPLQVGFYPFRIEYFHKRGEAGLVPIYLKAEGKEDLAIPVEMLYSDK
ncbi:alpha/beta hydrolase-fold protein [Niastella yeongjuensis]|nr:alpha/beta hydrolase-fold protein [Niastella yeongjuensis]SEO23331.1 Predicted hydrolase of the alpha/beta superfamily [Niastella yeongjuensis]